MSARVVVVGSGIVGAFAAFFLRRLGAEVVLVGRDSVRACASGNNPGGLNPLHGAGIPGPMQALALASYALHREHWEEIRERSGIDFGHRLSSRLHLAADDDDYAELQRLATQHDEHEGFAAEWLGRAELLQLEPRLGPRMERGLLTEGSGKVDAERYTTAVVGASGAEVMRREATGLVLSGARVEAVELATEQLPCDAVVLACGATCAEPAAWLGMRNPIEPVKGELLLVEPADGGVATDLAWRSDAAVYSTGGSCVWLGGNEERAGFDLAPTDAAEAGIRARANELLPGLVDAPLRARRVGLRAVTPDGFPIVGVADGTTNAFLALGAGRKGMLLATGMGAAVADLVVHGATELPVDACAPTRFSEALL